MKKLFTLLFAFTLTLVAAGNIYASGESTCQVVYGGGEVCGEDVKFTINKLVQLPTNGGEYVENLTVTDPKVGFGQTVNFKIVVENTGDTNIANLNITDTLPEHLTFVAGAGVTDEGSNKVSFVVGVLPAGESKEYIITTKVADSIDSNESIVCVTNNVRATTPDAATAEDNSQICIETPRVEKPTVTIAEKPNVEQIPATGPEMALLFGLIPAGAAGLYLRKKAN